MAIARQVGCYDFEINAPTPAAPTPGAPPGRAPGRRPYGPGRGSSLGTPWWSSTTCTRKLKSSLEHWLYLVRAAEWKSPNDVRNSFPKASVLNGSQAERSEVLGSRSRASEISNGQRALTVEGVGEARGGAGRIMINFWGDNSHAWPAGCRPSWRCISVLVAA